jgi:signal transduction histidine kinase
MLARLRRNLTITFIFVSLMIYAIVVPVGIIIFSHGLNSSVDANLTRLLAEIQPAVEFAGHEPTLHAWAESAVHQHVHILSTVQLYGADKNILESYGLPGVQNLVDGGLRADPRGRHKSIRSKFLHLNGGGYLQVQVETQQVDDAIGQFVLTMFILAPILLAATGACGWFFSAKAVKPVARSLHVLRRFVADAAHELKTPTTIIEASTQTLEEMAGEMTKAREIIDVLSRASQRMRKLAEDLVLLARMESPELALPMQVLSLDELIIQVVEDFHELAKNKPITLSAGKFPSAKVYGNADSLSRVLINLVDNAMRYTEAGGSIFITLEAKEQAWCISVEDTGIGIPPQSLPHIFDRFYRVDESRARAIGGTGLGLSIVHAIIDAHSGTITVESQVGKGTKFVITIPSRMVTPVSQSDAKKRIFPLTIIKS